MNIEFLNIEIMIHHKRFYSGWLVIHYGLSFRAGFPPNHYDSYYFGLQIRKPNIEAGDYFNKKDKA